MPLFLSKKSNIVDTVCYAHRVVSGDSLWNLASKYYGHGEFWIKIAKMNNIPDPNFIRAGTILLIPDYPPKKEKFKF